jgi:hypothetical protein
MPGRDVAYSLSAVYPAESNCLPGVAIVRIRTRDGKNPKSLSATVDGEDVTFRWDAVEGASSYHIQGPGLNATSPFRYVKDTQLIGSHIPQGRHVYSVWAVYEEGSKKEWGTGSQPARLTLEVEPPTKHVKVTLLAFQVDKETWDNAWELDGKGDEVFFTASVKQLNSADASVHDIGTADFRTLAYGDTNNQTGRVLAGTRSTKGGLKTNDSYPLDLSHPEDLPSTTGGFRKLPWVLWDGAIGRGRDAVLITPVIWEWDGNSHSAVFNGWVRWAQSATEKLASSPVISSLVQKSGVDVFELARVGLDVVMSFSRDVLGSDEDRPIGVHVVQHATEFVPLSITLNYENLDDYFRQGLFDLGNGAQLVQPGLVAISYEDKRNGQTDGKYVLYLRIER